MPSPPIRLLLISHASTRALRAARFPLDEEELDRQGGERAAALAAKRGMLAGRALCGPCRRTRETASALGLDAVVEPALRDLDPGRWAGSSIDELVAAEPEAVRAWMTDADAAPHGGESVTALRARVSAWLEGCRSHEGDRVVAVSHPAVLRAALLHALDAPTAAFWSIDVTPLAMIRLHATARGWRVRFGADP